MGRLIIPSLVISVPKAVCSLLTVRHAQTVFPSPRCGRNAEKPLYLCHHVAACAASSKSLLPVLLPNDRPALVLTKQSS
jgi:hypothetical protein